MLVSRVLGVCQAGLSRQDRRELHLGGLPWEGVRWKHMSGSLSSQGWQAGTTLHLSVLNYHQVIGRLRKKWSPASYNSSRKEDLFPFRDKDLGSRKLGNSSSHLGSK